MEVCLFITAAAHDGAAATATPPFTFAELEKLAAPIAGLRSAIMHIPVEGGTRDPYLKEEPPPRCALQFYFDELGALEAVLTPGGAMHALLDAKQYPAFAGAELTQQVMAVRRFPVPEPRVQQPGSSRCTYLVSYEGPAQDFNAWIGHYIDSHPPIMARFPDIREIEIYTNVDYRSDLPAVRSSMMQRNKVVFDSPAALQASMDSPVRHEMRADFKNFPPFAGANLHFPMISTLSRAAK